MAAAFVASAGIASAASADSLGSATLSSPIHAEADLIADNGAWHCEATTCVLQSDPSDVDARHACRQLEQQLGTPVAQMSVGKVTLTTDQVATCNRK